MAARDWSLYVQDTVLVSEFGAALPSREETRDRLRDQWTGLLGEAAIEAHLLVVTIDDVSAATVCDLGRAAATIGADNAVTKLAIVSAPLATADEALQFDCAGSVFAPDERPCALQWAKR